MIDLVPLAQFSERHSRGWRMVPGYPLQPGDYAVTMQEPGFPVPKRNKSLAAQHRNLVAQQNRRARLDAEAATTVVAMQTDPVLKSTRCECGRKLYSRGMCWKHWQEWRTA